MLGEVRGSVFGVWEMLWGRGEMWGEWESMGRCVEKCLGCGEM